MEILSINDIKARTALQAMMPKTEREVEAKEERQEADFTTADQINQFIMQEEGFRGSIYKDTVGVPTIGYGFNLQDENIRSQIDPAVLNGEREMTEEEAMPLLQKRVAVAERDAKDYIGEDIYESLTDSQKTALLSISYNLGGPKLNQFVNMQRAFRQGDMETAAKELFNSKRAKQLPNRTQREAEMFLK